MASAPQRNSRLTRKLETMPSVVELSVSIGASDAALREWVWLHPRVSARLAREALAERLRREGAIRADDPAGTGAVRSGTDEAVSRATPPRKLPAREALGHAAPKPSPQPPPKPDVARAPEPPPAPRKPDANSSKGGPLRRDLRAILEKARAAQNP